MDNNFREHLTLGRIAAHLLTSPFHFQKVFKKEVGETPKEYLIRIRMDRAAHLLFTDRGKSIYEVALDCGFSSQSVFARAFHKRYGMRATEFRNLSPRATVRLSMPDPTIQERALGRLSETFGPSERRKFLASITVKNVKPATVIYAPTTMESEWQIIDEFQALASRAAAHDLVTGGTHYYGLMYDFPLHTPLEKCRYRVCIGVPDDMRTPSDFLRMTIGGGKHAVVPVQGNFETMIQLGFLFFGVWLRRNRYMPSDLHWFERFTRLPTTSNYPSMLREIFVPIKGA